VKTKTAVIYVTKPPNWTRTRQRNFTADLKQVEIK
jgi:hypothetical protein